MPSLEKTEILAVTCWQSVRVSFFVWEAPQGPAESQCPHQLDLWDFPL